MDLLNQIWMYYKAFSSNTMLFPEHVEKPFFYLSLCFLCFFIVLKVTKLEYKIPYRLRFMLGIALNMPGVIEDKAAYFIRYIMISIYSIFFYIPFSIILIETLRALTKLISKSITGHSLQFQIVFIVLAILFYKFFFQGFLERKKQEIMAKNIMNEFNRVKKELNNKK